MYLSKSDATALSLSSACLIHCLALPFLASILPILGAVSDAEWVHRTIVLTTLPIVGWSFAVSHNSRVRAIFGVMAFTGTSFLVAGAFVEAFHDHETALTVCGALLLGGAHIYRWRRHQTR